MKAEKGRFVDLGEGSGAVRIFSLLNFAAIAKRMTLDFSDVFGKGISFDELTATVMADRGVINFVEPMVIDGTGGDFRINGTVNLLTGALDNEMVVTLPVSSSLPWYAAYLGFVNPIAAGAVLVGERLFRNQIDNLSSAKYKVGGTLQNPEVNFEQVFSKAMTEQAETRIRIGDAADGATAGTLAAGARCDERQSAQRGATKGQRRMSDLIEVAQRQLWDAAELRPTDVDRLLGRLAGRAIDIGELFFQSVRAEAWVMEDGIIKEGAFSADRGVGVRAMSGERTGFAYSDDIVLPALEEAAVAARSIVRSGGSGEHRVWAPTPAQRRYEPIDPIASLDENAKIALLRDLDARARRIDSRVKEVTIRLAANYETHLVVATDGTMSADIRPLVRLDVSVIVEQNGRRERGFSGGGGRRDLAWFIADGRANAFVDEAVRTGLVSLEAIPAPAGPMVVVLGPGWPGVLLHEAVGHGLEGDFNRKGTSAFSGRIGEQVASPLCTVVDDGTLPNRRGSLSVDDEGTPTQRTVLIENGVLKGYLQDRLNAKLMNTAPTGNGRRQSYAHSADAAHDQHIHARGVAHAGRDHRQRAARSCMR